MSDVADSYGCALTLSCRPECSFLLSRISLRTLRLFNATALQRPTSPPMRCELCKQQQQLCRALYQDEGA
jgi:hypothetical protein